jgi:uncharacterized protein (DUF1501 family)
MNISRRSFLRTGAITCGALGCNLASPFIMNRQLLAGNIDQNKKLLFIFQRGGNDGINTVIPRGDAQYNTDTRPTLFIQEQQAIDLGNGFAQLHPQLMDLMEIYNNSGINGQDGPGNLALIHRVGYADQSRSHFDSQDYWENGVPRNDVLKEGFIYRHLANTMDLSNKENAFAAAGLSGSQLLALKGPKPFPNFSRAAQYSLGNNVERSARFLGNIPTDPQGSNGKGFMGLFGKAPTSPNKPYRLLVSQTGEALGDSLLEVQGAVGQGEYLAANGASYPGGSFGNKLQEAAMLFKRTNVKVMGLNIGGWDTHSGQGINNGRQGDLLYQMGMGIQALYRDLQDQWDDLIIVTMTEFGRTSKENGSRGTDHAEASVMMVAGGGVKGGVYNCDADTWEEGAMFAKRDRYLSRRTDYRSVFAEIFTKHFGDSPDLMETIMPGYSQAVSDNPSDFQPLNFV